MRQPPPSEAQNEAAEWLTPGSAVEREWRQLRPGQKSDRYFNVMRCHFDAPSPTIMARGGSGPTGTTSCLMPDEARRFSIPELRAVCGFPPDYVLRGSYADRWERLGNAVPPLMMHSIAAHLRDTVFARIGRTRRDFKDAVRMTQSNEKPTYRVPTMAEIRAVRGSTGLTVASTFAGCGGSCTGYEMAGYEVLWSNEFLPIARESYAANHPHTVLDGRDIRKVQPEEILEATGLEPGELDVFNGSPPCQAFSSAGQGAKGWGKDREYSNGVKQRNEDLFFEYIRLLKGLQPRAFVAENVAGLVRGAAIGFFKIIMRELVDAGYRVRCKVLEAQWLGVPQTRPRAIFIGIRSDLDTEPEFPKPFSYQYTLADALAAAGSLKSDAKEPGFTEALQQEWALRRIRQSRPFGDRWRLVCPSLDKPSPTVLTGADELAHPREARRFTIGEARAICGFPPDYALRGAYPDQWARLGNAVPPLMMRAIAETLRDGLFTEIGRTRKAA
jgi:DNA (cytosine-5)-methyltransferase 1